MLNMTITDKFVKMTEVTGSSLLDILKQKMLQSKEELVKWKDEADTISTSLCCEVSRREDAENEVARLSRKIRLMEQDLDRAEERLDVVNNNLASVSQSANDSEEMVKSLEDKSDQDERKLALLEEEVNKAKLSADEADRNYEQAARKLILREADLCRAEERADSCESRIVELEE